MKKTLLFIIALFIIIISTLAMLFINVRSNNRVLQQENAEYEYYLGRDIYGTELVTLLNKAIDNNEKYKVEKDKNNLYIGNDTNSVLIKIQLENSEELYEMERIFALGTEEFINLFNNCIFRSDEVTYHSQTGKIATIVFRQITN